jgi:hypothetical protein
METTHQEFYTRRNAAKRSVMKQLELVTKIAIYKWYEEAKNIESVKMNHMFNVNYPILYIAPTNLTYEIEEMNISKWYSSIIKECCIKPNQERWIFEKNETDLDIFFKPQGKLSTLYKKIWGFRPEDMDLDYQVRFTGLIAQTISGIGIHRDYVTISIIKMNFWSIPTEKIEELAAGIGKIFLFDFIKYDETFKTLFKSENEYI